MKKCAKCGEVKPLSNFHKNKCRPDGVATYCCSCSVEVSRANKLKRQYALNPTDYEELLCMCDAQCMICGESASEHKERTGKFLAVDHSHVTGKVRGLLCDRCNLVLGKMEDNPDLLMKAVSYLTDRSE